MLLHWTFLTSNLDRIVSCGFLVTVLFAAYTIKQYKLLVKCLSPVLFFFFLCL